MTPVLFKSIEISASQKKTEVLRNCLPNNEELRASFDEKLKNLGGKARSLGVEVDGFVFSVRKYPGKVTLYVKRSPLVTLMYVLRFEKDYYTSNPALVFRPVLLAKFAGLQKLIDANIMMSRSWEEGINFR